MKTILICLSLVVSSIAGDAPENLKTVSPDGAFQVNVVKTAGEGFTRHLEIKGRNGETLFSSPPRIEGVDIEDFYPEHLLWSEDSRILAISAGYQKLHHTYLFAWDGKTFQSIKMPGIAKEQDNIAVHPHQWKDHTLHLKFDGPHAGKSDGHGYEGTAVVRVDLAKKTATKLSQEIKHDQPEK